MMRDDKKRTQCENRGPQSGTMMKLRLMMMSGLAEGFRRGQLTDN